MQNKSRRARMEYTDLQCWFFFAVVYSKIHFYLWNNNKENKVSLLNRIHSTENPNALESALV